MVAFRMQAFGGMVPLITPTLLPDNMAQVAVNASLRGGDIRGIRQPLVIHEFAEGSGFKKAMRIPDPASPGNYVWFGLNSKNADFYPNPLKNDAFNRFLWVDDNAPGDAAPVYQNSLERIKDGDPAILLGVPAPVSAPTLSVAGGSGAQTTRSYVYTYVNMFGEEGPPSDPITVSGYTNGTWNVGGMVDPTFATERGITKLRVYRTVTGNQGASFLRVVEQDVETATYADTRLDSAVALDALSLDSSSWEPPPELEGIIALPNGFFAGWVGKDLLFSEPYRPWAWPVEYGLSTEYPILDCGIIDQTLVVLTETAPRFFTGTTPASMTSAFPSGIEPCVEPNSIVQAPEGVYYASQNGLMLFSSSGLRNITREVIQNDQWNLEYLARIEFAASFDGQYIAMNSNGDGFVFDPGNPQGAVIQLANFPDVSSLWTDPYTAQVHLIVGDSVYQWGSASAPLAVAEWISKDFLLPQEVNFGAIQVNIDPSYAVGSIPDPIVGDTANYIGDPWSDETDIIGYNRLNGATLGTVPTWGSTPSSDPTAPAWPFWYGVVQEPTQYDLPEGAACLVSVLADYSLVWQNYVRSGQVYRMPAGFKSALWRVDVKTRVPVRMIQIAETAKELRRV